MDTSGKPGNSLQLIEDDPKFTHGTTAATTFRFLPGHRQSIAKFVQQTKQQEEEREDCAEKGKVGVYVQCQKGEKKLQRKCVLTTAVVQAVQKSSIKAA